VTGVEQLRNCLSYCYWNCINFKYRQSI